MKTNRHITLILALALASGATLRAAITVVNPAGANHTPFSICPAIDGANVLDPDPVAYLAPPAAGAGVLAELANGNTKFPGWKFNAGAALTGTLTINYYNSVFDAAHYSGADIKATYAPGPGDPASLRYVQMIDTTAPAAPTSPYIDPFPNDDTLPFYWTEKETQKFGLTFVDGSRRNHPPTSFVIWRGNLYLTSWDGKTPGTVTVHDGIRWGFDAGCINLPFLTTVITETATQPTVTLTWPATEAPSQVQTSSSLDNPLNWTPVTNNPSLSNGQYIVSLPLQSPQQFFRLSVGVSNSGAPPLLQPAYVRVAPQSDTVQQGHEAYLSVKADGSPQIAYQWFFNSGPIFNATNRELTYAHVQFTNQGAYFVVVSNAVGSRASAPAQLTVIQDTNPPTLVSAVASSNRLQIVVTFSEPVTPSTALNTFNYQVQQVNPPGGPPVIIMNATPGSDESIVILSPAAALTPNAQFFFHVGNIVDYATPPNVISPNPSLSTFATGP